MKVSEGGNKSSIRRIREQDAVCRDPIVRVRFILLEIRTDDFR
jgi:hypothetical protein